MPSLVQHLTAEQQRDILTLVDRFPCLFSDVPSRTTVLQHDIVLNYAKPIKQHTYRINPVKRAQMKQEKDYLQEHGFARRSSSPWSSPCLLETKSDGTPRFVTDYRKLNAVTIPDSYPLSHVEDCIGNLGTTKYGTKLDLLKG